MRLVDPFEFSKRDLKDLSLLLLRLIFGSLMFLYHGLGKVQRLTGGEEIRFLNFLGLGPQVSLTLTAFAEAGCSILLVLGLFTRLASIPLIINMSVIVFYVHIKEPDRLEIPLMFLAVYIVLFFKGAGKYSIDYRIGRNRTAL